MTSTPAPHGSSTRRHAAVARTAVRTKAPAPRMCRLSMWAPSRHRRATFTIRIRARSQCRASGVSFFSSSGSCCESPGSRCPVDRGASARSGAIDTRTRDTGQPAPDRLERRTGRRHQRRFPPSRCSVAIRAVRRVYAAAVAHPSARVAVRSNMSVRRAAADAGVFGVPSGSPFPDSVERRSSGINGRAARVPAPATLVHPHYGRPWWRRCRSTAAAHRCAHG